LNANWNNQVTMTLKQEKEIMAVMLECHRVIHRVKDEQALLDRLCETLLQLKGCRCVWIGFSWNDREKIAQPAALCGIDRERLSCVAEMLRQSAEKAIQRRAPVLCEDLAKTPPEPPWFDRAATYGFFSSLSLPLEGDGACIGVVEIYSAERNAFDEAAVGFFESFAEDLTAGLRARGTEKALQASIDSWEMKYRRIEKRMDDTAEALRKSRRLEAIGALVGGIAHDFNNILSPILGYTELALLEIDRETQLGSDLKAVLAAGERAKSLVQQILTFSREGEDEVAPLKLNPLIKESLRFLRSSMPATVEFNLHIDPECGHVLCTPAQIHQMVMHLFVSAYQMLSDGKGVITVSLTPFRADREWKNPLHQQLNGKYILFSIRSSGYHMAPAPPGPLLGSSFNSGEKENNAGMDLAVVRGIVTALSGHLDVIREPDQFAAFDLYFPLFSPAPSKAEARDPLSCPRGAEKILLVDDDDSVLMITSKLIEELGYQVTMISESSKALTLFRDQPEHFDLVITDQTMPRLSGTELARKMREIRPRIPIILFTGFSSTVNEENKSLYGISELLLKPVNRIEFAQAIRRALDSLTLSPTPSYI
jgi:signal transduction histidine kinase/ActR/RegA family two-component response regulator